jgi:hypothetical protein
MGMNLFSLLYKAFSRVLIFRVFNIGNFISACVSRVDHVNVCVVSDYLLLIIK